MPMDRDCRFLRARQGHVSRPPQSVRGLYHFVRAATARGPAVRLGGRTAQGPATLRAQFATRRPPSFMARTAGTSSARGRSRRTGRKGPATAATGRRCLRRGTAATACRLPLETSRGRTSRRGERPAPARRHDPPVSARLVVGSRDPRMARSRGKDAVREARPSASGRPRAQGCTQKRPEKAGTRVVAPASSTT